MAAKIEIEVPLAAQIDEIVSELALRERVYPRVIAAGKMTQEGADKRMERLRAVLQTLMQLEGTKRDANVDRMPDGA